jgi:uncharacterized protein (TIGR03435 family)
MKCDNTAMPNMTSRFICPLAILSAIACEVMNGGPIRGQSPAEAKPAALAAFEVATIKPSDPANRSNDCFIRGQPGGQTFVGRCVTLHRMMTWTYRLSDNQLAGEPDWLNTDLWDFQAKAEHPITRAELPAMFQAFLAERFGLKVHRESRTLSALVLTVDKGGAKMKANNEPDKWDISIVSAGGGPPPKPPKWAGQRCSMEYLAWWLGRMQNRPGVDQTGLPGFWDFTLEFVPNNLSDLNSGQEIQRKTPSGEPGLAFDGPSVYTALREQLGLKLESTKAPVPVMVIDHVEKATAN